MGMGAVAGVDDAGLEVAGEEIRCAGVRVAHDDDVGVHGLQGEGGVVERLALLCAAAGCGDVDDVGAENLARLLEGDAGAGGGLVEDGEDGLAAQGGDFANLASEHLAHGVGILQGGLDLVEGEVVEVEDVSTGERDGCAGIWFGLAYAGGHVLETPLMMRTSSTPSGSSSLTATCSSCAVGMFLPT